MQDMIKLGNPDHGLASMIVRHFSTEDTKGGAAMAAYRLHRALSRAGAESRLYVREKFSHDDDVIQLPPRVASPWPDRFRRLLRQKPIRTTYTFNLDAPPRVELKSLPDTRAVTVFHWMSKFLDVRSVKILADRFAGPLVWVIHDLDPVTGGCHYNFGCEGYRHECGKCPQLESSDPNDLSHRTWLRKQQLLAGLPICFVAPTGWGVARVRESSLFQNHRIEQIPLPLDTEIFRPYPKRTAREVLHLPPEKTILLFGASYLEDRRKGIPELVEALHQLQGSDILLLVVGLNGHEIVKNLPFESRYLGQVHDQLMMALAYQAADIFVCPSLADSGPMMIPEAMLCGTPVVAFDTGGAPDWIETGKTGYLARLGDTTDLANGIRFLLSADRQAMGSNARELAERLHDPTTVARRHLGLYSDLNKGN